ncbi:RING finger protein B [Yarrowia sp. B02]|nr:RING finger protein B [Yarrowia sp. B02]
MSQAQPAPTPVIPQTLNHRSCVYKCSGQIPPLLANCAVSISNSVLFMHGGFDHFTDEVSDKVHLLDLVTWTWSEVDAAPAGAMIPPGLCNHTATTLKNGLICIFGGEQTDGSVNRRIYLFHTKKRAWVDSSILPQAPHGKTRHSAALTSDETCLYFTGGSDPDPSLCLNLITNSWSLVPEISLTSYDHTSTIVNNRLWVLGGLVMSNLSKDRVQFFNLDPLGGGCSAIISKGTRVSPNICKVGMNVSGAYEHRLYNINCSSEAITSKNVTLSVFDTEEMAWKNDPLDPVETDSDDDGDDETPDYRWFGGVSWDDKAVIWGTLVPDSVAPIDVFERTSTHMLVVNLSGLDEGEKKQKADLSIDLAKLLDSDEYSDFVITGLQDEPWKGSTEFSRFTASRKKKFKGDASITSSMSFSVADHPPPYPVNPASPHPVNSDSYSSGYDSDVPHEEVANSQPIRVHAAVLVARWPYFKSLLDSGMSEAQTRTLHINEPIRWLSPMIRWLYTDTLEPESYENYEIMTGILTLSQIYCLPGLESICLKHLQRPLFTNPDEALLVWERIHDCGSETTSQAVAMWCYQHRRQVVESDGFRALTKDKVTALLQQMFDAEDADKSRVES